MGQRPQAVEQPAQAQDAQASSPQKARILNLLEILKPESRAAQRDLLRELTGKESRDDLTEAEADALIRQLKNRQLDLQAQAEEAR